MLYAPCIVTNYINKPTICTFCMSLFYNLCTNLRVFEGPFRSSSGVHDLLYLHLCTNHTNVSNCLQLDMFVWFVYIISSSILVSAVKCHFTNTPHLCIHHLVDRTWGHYETIQSLKFSAEMPTILLLCALPPPSPIRKMPKYYLKLNNNCFIPYRNDFHQSPYHLTIYHPNHDEWS